MGATVDTDDGSMKSKFQVPSQARRLTSLLKKELAVIEHGFVTTAAAVKKAKGNRSTAGAQLFLRRLLGRRRPTRGVVEWKLATSHYSRTRQFPLAGGHNSNHVREVKQCKVQTSRSSRETKKVIRGS